MTEIYQLDKEQRELFFRKASEIKGIPFEIIEKDYWVVWLLDRLFSLKDIRSHLTFKGGTSLSKVYGLIDRFSEDIDLSIEKELLGFSQENDPENAPSKKKQGVILDNLAKACSNFVKGELLSLLNDSIAKKLDSVNGWRIFLDKEDPDGQTLLFQYPSEASQNGYIRPIVKIEMGARSDHWPVSSHRVMSYAKEALNELVYEPDVIIKVLNAERTFWEKATILHQYFHLPQEKKLPPRISRHFYDFFQLLNSEVKTSAVKDLDLLERVTQHKKIYFSSSWASYETARKPTLRLFPSDRIAIDLEKDYLLMQDMIFGEVPDWNLILSTIDSFEKEFNQIDKL
jgi:predicted nucleotidyltransferase component of viral defense system